MINALHMRNFKCFKKLDLPTSALTVLTGFNAAGKSTAIQPLLLIGQYLRSAKPGQRLGLEGPLARLGTPGEVLSEHSDAGGKIELGISAAGVVSNWGLRAEAGHSSSELTLENISFEDSSGETTVIDLTSPLQISALSSGLRKHLVAIRDLIAISASRGGTPDTFPDPSEADPIRGDVGLNGQYAPFWLERYIDEPVPDVRRHPREEADTLRRQVAAWASELFPGVDVNAVRVPRASLTRLELRTRLTEDYRRPANIGYGLTYALPIIIAMLLAERDQLIIIDSPEAHLHPKAQSAMGRILALFASSGVQLFVETHSDHVINGIRLAVREKRLAPNDVAVHFFAKPAARDEAPSIISPALAGDGSVSEWPPGFFDQAEADQLQLAGWV